MTRRDLRRLLWRADARHMRLVWEWGPDGVECYESRNAHVRGLGRTGTEALTALLDGDA
jgi:hypothetical protein